MDEAKRELVRSWLLKASNDLIVAKIVARSPEAIWEASLYHCQQAAEKALKGLLVSVGRRVAKTHNLDSLTMQRSLSRASINTRTPRSGLLPTRRSIVIRATLPGRTSNRSRRHWKTPPALQPGTRPSSARSPSVYDARP